MEHINLTRDEIIFLREQYSDCNIKTEYLIKDIVMLMSHYKCSKEEAIHIIENIFNINCPKREPHTKEYLTSALLHTCNSLRFGDKITFTLIDETVKEKKIKGTYLGKLTKYGYLSEKYDEWSLCESYNDNLGFNIPSYHIQIRHYKCTTHRKYILVKEIKNIVKGWY